MKATRSRRASAEDRFFAKISEDTSGCWLWTGSANRDGYGRFYLVGGKKVALAHRWSYEFLIGEIPGSLQLDHLCRVRHCVNPWHLEPVTPRVNTLRSTSMVAAQAVATHCINGHPLDAANTYIRGTRGGKPGRTCITCSRATTKRNQARRTTCPDCGKEMTRGSISNHRRLSCRLNNAQEDRP